MAVNTDNFGFKKPDESDFYDVQDQNNNWDIADRELEKLNNPTFEDYTGDASEPEAVTAIEALKSKSKIGTLLSNIKAAFKGACLIGHIVNNCVTDNPNLPLSAAQGKALQDQLATLNSNLEWKYVADVIGSSTINIPSDACEIFVTVTKSSVIYDGVTTLSLLVPVRILSTVYQDFLNGGYGNNDQQTYLAFFRINKYNAHLYALKVAGQDYTATSQLKMWYR